MEPIKAWRQMVRYANSHKDEVNSQAVLYAEECMETLGLVRDSAENHLVAARMKVSPSIHVEGLTGGMQKIKDMADAVLSKEGEEE